MKKMVKSIVTATLVAMVLSVGTAHSGPVDWAAEKMGYVPAKTVEEKIKAAETRARNAESRALAAEEAAKAAEEAAEKAFTVIGYGVGLGMLVLVGGLAYIMRKTNKDINS